MSLWMIPKGFEPKRNGISQKPNRLDNRSDLKLLIWGATEETEVCDQQFSSEIFWAIRISSLTSSESWYIQDNLSRAVSVVGCRSEKISLTYTHLSVIYRTAVQFHTSRWTTDMRRSLTSPRAPNTTRYRYNQTEKGDKSVKYFNCAEQMFCVFVTVDREDEEADKLGKLCIQRRLNRTISWTFCQRRSAME